MTARAEAGYFELQLRFAWKLSQLAGVSQAEAVERCTNLRRRLGLWGTEGEMPWAAFLADMRNCASLPDALECVLRAHESRPRPALSPFGCFSYEPPDAVGTFRLHFMPDERHRDQSPLAAGSIAMRQSELHALFSDVRERYPGAREVRGLSWLYHTRSYRTLFPPAYRASLTAPARPLHLHGSSTWGQVLDYRGAVKPGIAERVLAGLDPRVLEAPRFAFSLQPLAANAGVEAFFAWLLGR